jgi:hypothetical protein
MQGMPSLNGKQNRIQKRIGVVQGIQAGAPGMLVKAPGMLVKAPGMLVKALGMFVKALGMFVKALGMLVKALGMFVKALGMFVNLWGFKTLAQHHPKEQSANSFGPVVKKPDVGYQTALIGQSGKTKCGVPSGTYRAIRKVPVAVRLPSR